MKILIMGGSYFIGWHLVQELSHSGHKVFVFNRGTKIRRYSRNVIHIKGDRNNSEETKRQIQSLKIDVVFDVSALKKEQISPILDSVRRSVKKYVFVSSSAVYLQSEVFPIKESFPVGQHHIWGIYGGNKLECERLLLTEHKQNNLDARIIRPSYVYGPDNYIPRETFIFERIARSRPIVVPGDGNAIVQLGNVKDLARALVSFMNLKGLSGEILNISGSEFITLDGLVKLIAQIMGKDVKIVHANPKDFGMSDREVFPFDNCTYFTDIQRAKKTIGFEPKCSLREGLTECYELWKNKKDESSSLDFSKEDRIIAAKA